MNNLALWNGRGVTMIVERLLTHNCGRLDVLP